MNFLRKYLQNLRIFVNSLLNPILFHRNFYRHRYGLHKIPKSLLWCHFLILGSWKHYDPHPAFITQYYLTQVKTANPFFHYILYGNALGFSPCPYFDPSFYREQLGSQKTSLTLLGHYLKQGWQEKLKPSSFFSDEKYLEIHRDVDGAKAHALLHFISFGRKERRAWIEAEEWEKLLQAFTEKNTAQSWFQASSISPACLGTEFPYQVIGPVTSCYEYSKKKHAIFYETEPEKVFIREPQFLGKAPKNFPGGYEYVPIPYVARLEKMTFLAGTRFAWTKDKTIFHDEVDADKKELYGTKSQVVKRIAGNVFAVHYQNASSKVIPSGILISCDYDANYFHWMAESLPKVFLADEAKIPTDVPLLVLEGLHENLMEALQIINQNKRPIILLKQNVTYQVDTLFYPANLSYTFDRYHGNVETFDYVLSHRWISKVSNALKNHFLQDQPKREPKKYYLTRRNGGARKLINEKEIEEQLYGLGFEIMDLNTASLSLQVKMFANADIVVAPSGATCTDQIFCNPKTQFYILTCDHPNMNFYIFDQVGAILGLNPKFVLGPPVDRMLSAYSFHDDFYVDPRPLISALQREKTSASNTIHGPIPGKKPQISPLL